MPFLGPSLILHQNSFSKTYWEENSGELLLTALLARGEFCSDISFQSTTLLFSLRKVVWANVSIFCILLLLKTVSRVIWLCQNFGGSTEVYECSKSFSNGKVCCCGEETLPEVILWSRRKHTLLAQWVALLCECCVRFCENWSSLCLEVCLRQQICLLRNGKHIFLSTYKYTCLLIWYYGHSIKPFRLIYKVARTVMNTAGFMLSTVCSAPFFLTVVEKCGFGLL